MHALAFGCTLASACLDAGEDEGPSCGPREAVVARVVDGDTIVLESGERVRYLLVDTPENTSEVGCYGPEASLFNQQQVQGRTVELTYDVECRDVYDRLLAYVKVQGRDLNALLVERGYACVLHIPPNGEDRVEDYRALEAEARRDARGMWGVCEEIDCD